MPEHMGVREVASGGHACMAGASQAAAGNAAVVDTGVTDSLRNSTGAVTGGQGGIRGDETDSLRTRREFSNKRYARVTAIRPFDWPYPHRALHEDLVPNMNEPSRWRQDYARRAARAYAEDPRVAAIIVGGSTGRGHADQWSDIELGVFWTDPPTDTDRSRTAARLDGSSFRLYPYDQVEQVWCDDFYLGGSKGARNTGVLLEVVHMTTTAAEEVIGSVVHQNDPDPTKQSTIAAICDGAIIHGTNTISEWRRRVDPYPKGLAAAVVNANAQIDNFWRSEMWIDRGNNVLMLNASFVDVGLRLIHTLCGLNRVYFFGTKWIDVVIDRFDVKPADFGPRLKEAFVLPPRDGAEVISGLVEETYDLVEDSGLGVDVERLRSIFRFSRTPWGAIPPPM